jgi:hypothetical protein
MNCPFFVFLQTDTLISQKASGSTAPENRGSHTAWVRTGLIAVRTLNARNRHALEMTPVIAEHSCGGISPSLYFISRDGRHRFAHRMRGLHDSEGGLRVFSEASLEHDELLFLGDPDSARLAHGGHQVGLASYQSDRIVDGLHGLVLVLG